MTSLNGADRQSQGCNVTTVYGWPLDTSAESTSKKVQQARANLITSYSAHRPTLTAVAYELNFFPTIRGDFSGSYSHWVQTAWAGQMANER